MSAQLDMDTALKEKERLPGSDGWKGNCYQTYGLLYGIQVLPATVKGEYIVRHVRVRSEKELDEE